MWCILPFLVVQQASGQADLGRSSILVTDELNKTVPLARIRIVALDTGESHWAEMSAGGWFTIRALLPGEYSVIASAAGFAAASTKVLLPVGGSVRQKLVLLVRPNVSDTAPAVGSDSSDRLVTRSELSSLPNLTRDPYRFSALAGNVSEAGVGTRGVGLAMNGQRESSTSMVSDGAIGKDEFAGAVGAPLALD
ncbi:MAG TPA: carboxypeptidase-like regulatory domain-containing protein, partial [Bryobacteraceae bacterium]|nr:carboxypeptidase-like regulatory domain-containing protein [Bryobacteraceae bacterium]